MKKVSCRISEVHLRSEDTLLMDIYAHENFQTEDFYDLKKAALKIGNGKSYYNIIKVGRWTIPSRAARIASSSVEGSYYKKADAIVVDTLYQKIIGTLMVRVHRPVVPTKFFKSVKEAEKWLDALKSKQIVLQAI